MKVIALWDSRVAWSILERLGRLDRGSNPRYPINILLIFSEFYNNNFSKFLIIYFLEIKLLKKQYIYILYYVILFCYTF